MSVEAGVTTVRTLLPGLIVALGVALVGYLIHERFDVLSPHVVAVTFGIVGASLGHIDEVFRPGLKFAAKKVLRTGIVLLGFRLSLSELGKLGPRALVCVVIVVVATFFGTQLLAKRMGLSRSLGLLVATGYSICGASAIAAVEPFADATEEEVAYSIALVTICGTLAIGVLPLIGRAIGLPDAQFGSWVGASVHDVGQVVAASSIRGDVAQKTAIVVKLTRVVMLAPLLAGVAVAHRRRSGAELEAAVKRPPILPLFIVSFLAAVAIRTGADISKVWLSRIKVGETILLGMGLVGLGSGVDINKLKAVGGRPLVLGLASWLLVAVVSLVAVKVSYA